MCVQSVLNAKEKHTIRQARRWRRAETVPLLLALRLTQSLTGGHRKQAGSVESDQRGWRGYVTVIAGRSVPEGWMVPRFASQ